MNRNPNLPAFPVPDMRVEDGLTKREYFAAHALQGVMAGLIANGGIPKTTNADNIFPQMAAVAVCVADHTIHHLDNFETDLVKPNKERK